MLNVFKFFLASILLFVTVVGFLVVKGKIPDSKAVTGAELSNSAKVELVESGILSQDETIEYFYSEGFASFVEYGNLFTNTRVISYELDYETNERNLYSAVYSGISDIEFSKSDDFLADSIIEVYEAGELSFSLVVSNEEDGDEAFYKKLVEKWNANSHRVQQAEASVQGENQ